MGTNLGKVIVFLAKTMAIFCEKKYYPENVIKNQLKYHPLLGWRNF
jgi:hypothetical protein